MPYIERTLERQKSAKKNDIADMLDKAAPVIYFTMHSFL